MLNSEYGVILGLYGANALGVARSLGAENIPVRGFHQGTRFPHAKYSRFVQKSYMLKDSDNLLENLMKFGKNNNKKSVLFSTDDKYVLFCQDNYDELKNYFHIPISSKGNLNDLLDKNTILKIGESAGFSVPKSGYLSNLNEDIIGKIITKPVNSLNASKDDFFLFDSIDELCGQKQQLLNRYGDVVYQQYVEGGVKEHIEVHTYKDKQNNVHIAMIQKEYASDNKSKATKGSTGAIAKTIWLDELKQPSEKLTRHLDFTGPLDINLKKDINTGKYYFFEVNFRTSANVALDTAAGLNLPALVYADFNEKLKTNESIIAKQDVYWGMENRIVSLLDKGEFDNFSEFRNILDRIDVYAFFSQDDNLPFIKAASSLDLKSR
ncbi:MAG: hypothetical protein ACLFN8_00425 [Candidatus Woesearchaeota archaeon]